MRFLSEPYDALFAGFLRTLPECYVPGVKPQDPFVYRDFMHLDDLDRANRALAQMEIVMTRLNKLVPNLYDLATDREECELFGVITQMFALWTLTGKLSYRALKPQEIPDFIVKAFKGTGYFRAGEHKSSLSPYLKGEFIQKLFLDHAEELTPLWSLALNWLESEISHIKDPMKVDAKFISSLWVQDLAIKISSRRNDGPKKH